MTQAIVLRAPTAQDGAPLHRLIQRCPPLDPNSLYCNLLHCSHFAATAVAAECEGELVGFVSGYLIPGRENTLFVWQIAVGEQARGQGLGLKLLRRQLQADACRDVHYIETTITESNRASMALFEKLAAELGTEITRSVMFDRDEHFGGEHETEMLIKLGPF